MLLGHAVVAVKHRGPAQLPAVSHCWTGWNVVLQALAPGGSTRLDAAALAAIADGAPAASLPRGEVLGRGIADVMVAAGLQPSKAASRRMIKVGAACSLLLAPGSCRHFLLVHERRVLPRVARDGAQPSRIIPTAVWVGVDAGGGCAHQQPEGG